MMPQQPRLRRQVRPGNSVAWPLPWTRSHPTPTIKAPAGLPDPIVGTLASIFRRKPER